VGQSATLKQIYEPIQAEIDRVEKALRDELTSDNPFVGLLLKHSTKFAGKRVRPALLLYCAKICGGVTDAHIALSAVVELLHTATLVHDDVLDEALLRRKEPTMSAVWGNEASVLFGDLLFAKAYTLCARLHNREANRILAQTVESMCLGELSQIGSKFNFNLGEQEYFRIIRAKTADLFATACRLGTVGWEADKETVEALGRYGLAFGMAFQIVDDCLDLVGDEREVGKSLGTDLMKGKPTLPLIRLLGALPPGERKELQELLSSPNGLDGKRDAVLRRTREHDVVGYAQARARGYLEEAKAAIRSVPCRDPQLVELVISLADYALFRRA
jgi:octaprenyl-diphosphate synthase